MQKITEWVLSEPIHLNFAPHIGIDRNKKMSVVGDMFQRESHLTFLRYWDTAGKLKSLAQWRGKRNAQVDPKIPLEATLACGTHVDIGRVIAIRFILTTDEAISTD